MELEDLIACWTLIDPDWELIGSKPGATRLGFAALLKFFEIDGRFPEYGAEVPEQAVAYLAKQVKVDPALFTSHGDQETDDYAQHAPAGWTRPGQQRGRRGSARGGYP